MSAIVTRGSDLSEIAEKVWAGERLSFEDGLRLFETEDLLLLGSLADLVRRRKHPDRIVTFNIGRNINYTNVCWVRCKFCAFYRVPGHEEGYTLTTEEVLDKCRELVELGGREILIQGGLNPKLKIDYYEDLFRAVKMAYPVIDIHGLSSAEINYVGHISKLSLEETLRRLRAAGMNTIPGAGEMLVDEVREQIAPLKEKTSRWVELMRTAHRVGIRSSATMVYGWGESYAQRLEHMLRVRELQDETGGFTAWISWSFQPDGTELGGKKASGWDYLKNTAVSRLMLDNIPSLQASWVTQGPKLAQVALKYGLNDFGSTMMEENVVSPTGTNFLMQIDEIRRLITEAGYEPRVRDTLYNLLD
ncbi:MAG TPA: cyclic dehypoxanthinyl futalosine synthase [Armatimonadota bacterium]|nr:cyclic dehypoxanthinyl futalosine synthase [Armatimonadota bacterium]